MNEPSMRGGKSSGPVQEIVPGALRTSPSPSASVDLAHLRPRPRSRFVHSRHTSPEPEAEGDRSPSMPAVSEALAERDVIRSTIYSGSTGRPDVAIKPESKGRHHSIARPSAMGPPSGFVTGSSNGRHAHQGTACLPSCHRCLVCSDSHSTHCSLGAYTTACGGDSPTFSRS